MNDVLGTVYLIHFERPYYHARHYVGWTTNLEKRIETHRKGNGSPLLRAATAAGIGWGVVRTWEHKPRAFERWIKTMKHTWRYCPICKEERHGTKHW